MNVTTTSGKKRFHSYEAIRPLVEMAEISLWLFGKPEWEIDTEKATPKGLRKLGVELKERLEETAGVLEKLQKNGWENAGGLYDLFMFKDISKKEAQAELRKLGIKGIEVMETEEDEL